MEYIITCISHRRPENIKQIFKTTGTEDIVFVVNDEIDKNLNLVELPKEFI